MVRLTDRPDMTLDVYRGLKTTMQQQQQCTYTTNTNSQLDNRFHSSLKGIQKKSCDLLNLYPIVTVNKILFESLFEYTLATL